MPSHALWGIVLAGGEGVRLRAFVHEVCGDERPKQYAALFAGRTMLEQTLARVGLEVAPARTAVVSMRSHARFLAGRSVPEAAHLLLQPASRGTAAGILLGAHWVSWRDREATVAIFPSDHYVREEAAFMRHVARVAGWVDAHPERVVLLGASPTEAEAEYGWIEPGEWLGATADGALRAVRRFHEKPPPAVARICFEAGCLWNTLVLVARVPTLLRLGALLLPVMSERMAWIAPFAGTPDEAWAVQQAYALMPDANFSHAVLEAGAGALAVSRLPGVTWHDLGHPRRAREVAAMITAESVGPRPGSATSIA